MKNRMLSVGIRFRVIAWAGCLAMLACAGVRADTIARGVVYHDRNGDGLRDAGDAPLSGMRVSNGRDIVLTDEQGRYELKLDDDDIIFVIKPRGYRTRIDAINIPRFYHIHKPAGSPKGLEYPGVLPTGPLPESVDFALTPNKEPDRFDVVLFGDPQPRDVQEVDYLAHDVIEELVGVDAAFGVSLGDVAFDHLDVYEPQTQVVGTMGIPWYYVHGNHDQNYDVKSDELADETWERVFGPTTYSFDYGPVHFIVLDDVEYDGAKEHGRYHSEIGRHLAFIENDLKLVEKDALVVLMMHIPLIETVDKDKLLKLLESHPNVFSISAHWHAQKQFSPLVKADVGEHFPHHHLVHATSCGGWWRGEPDERGIPHATMRDGAPNGYSIVTFDGNKYSLRFKAARRPADDQMAIYTADCVAKNELSMRRVWANVYTGGVYTTVEMRMDKEGPWVQAERVEVQDPYYAKTFKGEQKLLVRRGHKMPEPIDSPHIWSCPFPADLQEGAHVVYVRTKDPYYGELTGHRVFRVGPPVTPAEETKPASKSGE